LKRDHHEQEPEENRAQRHGRRKLRRFPGNEFVDLCRINLKADRCAKQKLYLEGLKSTDDAENRSHKDGRHHHWNEDVKKSMPTTRA
jgi:hypothetical protein